MQSKATILLNLTCAQTLYPRSLLSLQCDLRTGYLFCHEYSTWCNKWTMMTNCISDTGNIYSTSRARGLFIRWLWPKLPLNRRQLNSRPIYFRLNNPLFALIQFGGTNVLLSKSNIVIFVTPVIRLVKWRIKIKMCKHSCSGVNYLQPLPLSKITLLWLL